MTMKVWTKYISVIIASSVLLGGHAWAAELPPASVLGGMNDSGVQLSRTRQYLEWQRTMQRISEGREASQVEDQRETTPEDT